MLEAAHERRVDLVTSLPLLAELTDILSRRKFEKKIIASLLTIDQIVDRYAVLTTLVRPEAIPRTAPDPDDDVVLGTALAAKADGIVSGDGHLLEMKTFQGMLILTAGEAVPRAGK